MNPGKRTLTILTFLFILSELIFLSLVITRGNGDVIGAIVKTAVFLLFIFLYSRKFVWAKWILIVLLFLHAIILIPAGMEQKLIWFYLLSLYNAAFAIMIIKLPSLKYYKKEKKTVE